MQRTFVFLLIRVPTLQGNCTPSMVNFDCPLGRVPTVQALVDIQLGYP